MLTLEAHIKRLVLVRIDPGEDILDSLKRAVARESITNGVILDGIGSTQSHRYHVVADTNLPPLEAFPAAAGARDIVGLSGAVIDGRVHAHITLSDSNRAEGGHLEPGTRALTFAVIAIADIGDTSISGWDSAGATLGT